MTALPTYEANKDWTQQGDVLLGKGEAATTFRGLQAGLNYFGDVCGFPHVKVDGALGPKTLAALAAVYKAVVDKNIALAPTMVVPKSVDEVGKYAPLAREWLDKTARNALGLGALRLYKEGAGQDWNVKGAIAYGAGPVHADFVALQGDLNQFAGVCGFAKLETDGFIGEKTAAAVTAVYQKCVAKSPAYAVTFFPPPDTKEEAAEFCAFIRDWLEKIAKKALLAEANA